MGISDVARRSAIAVCLFAISASAQAQPSQTQASPAPAGTLTIQVRTIEVRDIALGSIEKGGVTVERGRFSGVRPDGAVVSIERIAFERVVVKFGDRTISAPEIVISNAEMPAEIFRLLTEGGGQTLDWASLFERMAAREIAIAAITEDDPVVRIKASYGELVLAGLRAGVVESGQIGTVVATSTLADGGDEAVMRAGPVRWRGINIAEFLRLSTGGRESEPVSLIDNARLEGFSVTSRKASVSTDIIEISGVHGHAPVSSARADPVNAVINPPSLAKGKTAARYLREILRHGRIDRYRVSGLRISAADMGTLSIAGITLDDVSGRGIGLFELDGFSFGDNGTAVKIGRFSVEKLAYGRLVDDTLRAIEEDRKPPLSPAQLSEAGPRLGGIRLTDLLVDTPAGFIGLGKAALEVDNPDAAIPERVSLAISGLKLDVRRLPQGDGRDELLDLGYRQLAGEMKVRFRWLPSERTFVIDETMLSIDEGGRMDLGLRFGNVDLSAAAAAPEIAEQIMDAATIESIEVRLANTGLADRFFAQVARRSGVSNAEARAILAADLTGLAVDLFGSALASGAPAALRAFILEPKQIVVRMLPRQGQPRLSMGDLDRLDLSQINARVRITIEAPAD